MHPVKKAVCEEILNLLNSHDSAVRKATANSLRKPRYFFSRTERAQIDYFIDKNNEYLDMLIARLCQLISDISPEVQKATLITLGVFKKYRGVTKTAEGKRHEIIKHATDLIKEGNLRGEVLIQAAELLVIYKARESKTALENAYKELKDNYASNAKKVESAVLKSIKLLARS